MSVSNEVITTKGLKVEFYYSDDDPREWDNITKMVCFHNNYNLGDEHDYNKDDFNSWEELKEAIESNENVLAIKPLYLYDHSGQTISTSPFSCKWDSGQVGWVYITEETVALTGMPMDNDLDKAIEQDVAIYKQRVEGDVYGFICYKDGKQVDSCGGFYGIDIETNGMKEYLPDEFIELLKSENVTEVEVD